MVGILRDHDVGQQPGRRDTLIDDLCRHRRLNQRFAVITDPLATDMAFDGKHARRVVQFFADIFTDTLECAAARTMSVFRFMVDQRAWELRRQRRALGLLFFSIAGEGVCKA